MFVPSRMREVHAASCASTSNGSSSGDDGLIGGTPSALYGYGLVMRVGKIRCSGIHTDSKPSTSVRRATGTNCSGRSKNNGTPIFMGTSLPASSVLLVQSVDQDGARCGSCARAKHFLLATS